MSILDSPYQKRISGPLLDRVDIHVEVPRVEFEKLASDRVGEPSASIRERVEPDTLRALFDEALAQFWDRSAFDEVMEAEEVDREGLKS